MNTPLTILAVFAHPDDEIGVGSTLTRYGEAGARTVLVCATRGEAATIYCNDCATAETLAQVRTGELECACQHLGISELRWLDWPDGGVAGLPRDEAVRQIVQQIRDIRPHVIITHPENGLYPHPDHLAVWEITRTAFTAAADPAAYPEAGPAWAAARLFTRAIAQSYFDAAPGLKEFRVKLNGQELPFYGTPDDQIDITMHVAPWVARRMAAWACHRSQHNPQSFTSTMPESLREMMVANEQYLLAAARIPLPDGATDDLLAGLSAAETGAGETDGAAAAEPSQEYVVALIVELAAGKTLTEVLQAYLRTSPEPKQAQLYRQLGESTQEVIYRLARALRVAGEPAGVIEPDVKLRQRGQRQQSGPERSAFLRNVIESAIARFRVQARHAATPYQQAVWEELIALMQEQAAAVAAFAG